MKPNSRRWLMISFAFLATLINYLDRQTLSVAAPALTEKFHMTNQQYSVVLFCFLLAYTIMNGVSGPLIDRLGTRLGYALCIAWWSAAAILHAFSRGAISLGLFRFLLGAGEAGNWPAAIRIVAEWFPKNERALASGLFNSGSAVGSIIAPPLVAFIMLRYGWEYAFVVVGILGFIWLTFWWPTYKTPPEVVGEVEAPVPNAWKLFKTRFVWSFTFAKIFLDPVWYFYTFWFPKYLNTVHHFDMAQIGKFAWIPYFVAGSGNILGGWFSGLLVRRGLEVTVARKTSISVFAVLMMAAIPAVLAPSAAMSIAWVSVAMTGYTGALASMLTLPADVFPKNAVASVYGLASMGSGFGGMLFTLITGWAVEHYSYTPVFIGFGLIPLLCATILWTLTKSPEKNRNIMTTMSCRILATALLLTVAADARVTRLNIEKRDSSATHETLSGHFSGELDPKDPHNAIITDIQLAPRNAKGFVEYTATFMLVKPLDMSKASGVLLYSVPNRGTGVATPDNDGHVTVVSGWQGDVFPAPNLQSIQVPIVPNVTGPVVERFVDMPAGSSTLDITRTRYVGLAYQKPVTLDTSKASLTRRTRSGESVALASNAWAFADCVTTPFPGTPDATKICTKDGFNPEFEYILSFTAKDPLVLGIGYAATRDLNSFLRYDPTAENPVAGKIKWAVSRGSSQSGNFIRSFIHLGFNQDEQKRIVWDGTNPQIAARQIVLNLRFANPGGAAGLNEPGSEAVLWWNDYADKTRNRPTASLLTRCKATNTCPKIFETFGALEFWYLRESPNLVGTDAKKDIPLPANVRRYFFPGTSHGGGRGGFTTKVANPPAGCLLPANPNPETDQNRALLKDLIDWVSQGTEPPASRYPRLDRGELAEANAKAIGFPSIPGYPSPDGLVNSVLDHDFGSEMNYNDVSGIMTKNPPTVKRVIPTLVPKVNADGSDVSGVPSVLRDAPLGSYLGWNPTATGFDKGRQCTLSGGFIPFAATKTERTKSGDPRLSIEERYKDHAGYVAVVKAAAEKAVKERFLLPDDAKRLIAEAEASDVLK